jgi:uncharacterized protein (DUF2235 family)
LRRYQQRVRNLEHQRRVGQRLDLAFATGLPGKIERAYTYLAEVWQPGDEVFLFGFSRGAYTARVLAAQLHTLGLLPARNGHLIPYALRLFQAIRGSEGSDQRQRYWRLCDEFRSTFARELDASPARRFPVHFLGLWDTVSSVGGIGNG